MEKFATKQWVEEEKLWECSECHAEVEKHEKDCWNCGARFKSKVEFEEEDNLKLSPAVRICIGIVAGLLVFSVMTLYSRVATANKAVKEYEQRMEQQIPQLSDDQNVEASE